MKDIEDLYKQLDAAKPGSEASRQIAEEILNAIGEDQKDALGQEIVDMFAVEIPLAALDALVNFQPEGSPWEQPNPANGRKKMKKKGKR